MNLHLFFPKPLTSICLVALYAARALCVIGPRTELPVDFVKSGNYLITYCEANIAVPHAAYLQRLIPYMQSHLEAVLTDLDRGTASPAFRAFFKTNSNLEPVRQVFTNIINGSDFVTVNSRQSGQYTAPPTLVCTDTEEPFLDHLQDDCYSYARPMAYIINPQKMVAICRLFWTLPHIARNTACPRIVNGKVLTEPSSLVMTQYAILVHELVHLYNRHDDSWVEVFDFDGVVGLDAIRSLENAQNFAAYAAGQLPLPSSAMVHFVKEKRADDVRRFSYFSGLYGVSCSPGFRRWYVCI